MLLQNIDGKLIRTTSILNSRIELPIKNVLWRPLRGNDKDKYVAYINCRFASGIESTAKRKVAQKIFQSIPQKTQCAILRMLWHQIRVCYWNLWLVCRMDIGFEWERYISRNSSTLDYGYNPVIVNSIDFILDKFWKIYSCTLSRSGIFEMLDLATDNGYMVCRSNDRLFVSSFCKNKKKSHLLFITFQSHSITLEKLLNETMRRQVNTTLRMQLNLSKTWPGQQCWQRSWMEFSHFLKFSIV